VVLAEKEFFFTLMPVSHDIINIISQDLPSLVLDLLNLGCIEWLSVNYG